MSNRSKHTPGPWQVKPFDVTEAYWRITATRGGHDTTVALVSEPRILQNVTGANARLIAAAPELLEACEAALHALEGQGPVAMQLRAVIAKVNQ